MTSIKLPESRNNFREVTERFTSRKLFLLSGSSYQKWVCLNLYAPLIKQTINQLGTEKQ
ncbi:MAG: hypothetical protein U5N85_23135 [Arcicella sp.]|nr:hypothetical protein [Arcicella sp.]